MTRRGFTLIEVLVVIAIIGAILALLLPAVSAGAGGGTSTQTQANLRQIGLALHQYHETTSSLPPAYLSQVDQDGFIRDGQFSRSQLQRCQRVCLGCVDFSLP